MPDRLNRKYRIAPSCPPPGRPAHLQRRRRLLHALGVGSVALLSGCGFALRKTPALPFSRLQIVQVQAAAAQPVSAAPTLPLLTVLRMRLLAQDVQLLDSPDKAEAVLQVLQDRRSKRVVASTSVGQVRELELRVVFGFRLTTPGGRELITDTELLLTRDMSYNETAALSKAQEEAELFGAMQADIVAQVLRRLASAPMGR